MSRPGFTIIELMICIGIVILLVSIVTPSLLAAKELAKSVQCQSQIKHCSDAMQMQAVSCGGVYLPAYTFLDGNASSGYTTWAGHLMQENYAAEGLFHCPAFTDGGLAASNPRPEDRHDGQIGETDGVVDIAPRRCAFVPNEVICPRDRFDAAAAGVCRASQTVGLERVSPDEILFSEFATDWRIMTLGDDVCRSYLPVHGLMGMGPMGPDRYDLNRVAPNDGRPCFDDGCYRRFSTANLQPRPREISSKSGPLNWIGRNHGNLGPNGFRQTSLAFTDGHAERTRLPQTFEPFLWGRKVYSVVGDDRIHP